ncbi:hypothetical protein [Muriicola soli]|uniref:Uncharacterized protein n=1 Tax=Muriicola soli TaxID=2507538 RepID=A0A411ECC4_9FLAO|nr:hypothetical protein [Muriicola soli]QBA65319.1 hypothetical protein EQY75_12735 [Muriicola soli]
MKKAALIISILFLSCAQSIDREITPGNPELQSSMKELLQEIEQDMITLLEAQEQNSPAFYYLDKTRNRLRNKLDSLSLLEEPDLLSRILELDAAKRRLLQTSNPSNPVIRNLDEQIDALKEQME